MAASQPMHAPAGPLFVGQPYVVDGLDDFLDGYQDLVEQAIFTAIQQAQNSLRSEARRREGWRDLANTLTVSYDYNGLVYAVDGTEEQQDKAKRLEFGDEQTAPTGFLRKMASAQAMDAGFTMSRILNEEVPVA